MVFNLTCVSGGKVSASGSVSVLVCVSGGWSAGYLVLVLGSRPPNQ